VHDYQGVADMSDDNIIELFEGELDADTLLDRAKEVYTHVVTVGWDSESKLNLRATSNLRNEDVVFILELAKNMVLSQSMAEDDDYE
jgi:ribosomal protein S15P/S13E